MKRYYIYILESAVSKEYYVGTTSNLERRIRQHNSGRVRSTRPMRPWHLKYQESYPNISSARTREMQIKSWKKRSAIEKLIRGAFV
ncbi:TPA: endonuclease [Candidatus Giovannonibacteria bacterium]|nr:endonuclease [Candidatus Giovannonibacteria bacterium]